MDAQVRDAALGLMFLSMQCPDDISYAGAHTHKHVQLVYHRKWRTIAFRTFQSNFATSEKTFRPTAFNKSSIDSKQA